MKISFQIIFLATVTANSLFAHGAEVDSVVTIYSKSNGSISGQGTGFFFTATGKILTAYHVIQDSIELEAYDKNLNKINNLRVERIDEKRDLAILSSQTSSSTAKLSLSGSAPPAFGNVRIAGSPRGLPQQVIHGKVTSASFVASNSISSSGGKRIFQENIDILPVDITVYGGMSGAPVISADGTVIGVLSGSYDEGRGLAWAIPVKYVDDLQRLPLIDQPASSTFRWPRLRLMDTAWVSLKRSYSQPFDSMHLAKLESLEGVYRLLKGQWRGSSPMKNIVYTDKNISNYFGTCELVGAANYQLDIQGVDAAEPMLVGRVSSTIQVQMQVEYGSAGNQPARDTLQSKCGFKGGQMPPASVMRIGGSFEARSDVDEDTPADNRGYLSVLKIQQCTVGSSENCAAAAFGIKKSGRVEVISPTRIRWQNTILDKVGQ